ncbi:protein kinase [Paenibacillus sp. N1-5-1-14]|uniref:serine/threonine protein kinase n=1 Tax=Paenibacillus radicibacter TaxID=2972488 RepID=UPI002158B2AA|nr:protein kinase [Paenibacillus radicibacter]MCR8645504.1 protein kinase [Paenibacillus radicibacter]
MGLFEYLKGVYEAWIDYPQREGAFITNKYRIQRFLGIGSYGLTYLCLDVDSGQEVVLKQAKPSKRKLGRDVLYREIDILGQLRHPSIQRCITSFDYKEHLYMVSEYVKGQTVQDMIFERGSKFSEKDALCFVRRLIEIVSYVHDQGFVHLDIRIPNVILNGDQIYLIDFGLACRLGEPIPEKIGSVDETMQSRTAEVPDDLNAIGHFILFMLYSGYDSSNFELEVDSGWEDELTVSPMTKQMLRKLLQIDPPYRDIEQFVCDLDSCLDC